MPKGTGRPYTRKKTDGMKTKKKYTLNKDGSRTTTKVKKKLPSGK